VSDSAASDGTLPGALLRTLVAQQAKCVLRQGDSNGHARFAVRVAASAAHVGAVQQQRGVGMYIGFGTLVVILVVVLIFSMMRRSRA
jgi:hypothetical protein